MSKTLEHAATLEAIHAHSVIQARVTAQTKKSLAAYEHDPQAAVKQYQRAVVNHRRREHMIHAIGIIGLITATVATILAAFGQGNNNTIGAAAGVGVGLMFITMIAIVTNVPPGADKYAVAFLETRRNFYLPRVDRSASSEGITVSLSHPKSMTSRMFTPDQVEEALEYQVELEEIIEQAKEKQIATFITKCCKGELETQSNLSLSSAVPDEVEELEEILASQERTVTVSA